MRQYYSTVFSGGWWTGEGGGNAVSKRKSRKNEVRLDQISKKKKKLCNLGV